MIKATRRVGIIGGGPSALFLFQELLKIADDDWQITVFESSEKLGCGMPYSDRGATKEHITNVSGDETPGLPQSLTHWIQQLPASTLKSFEIDRDGFNDRKPVPRLLFGDYLSHQFELLLTQAQSLGVQANVHLNCRVADVIDNPASACINIVLATGETKSCDAAVMCTGHVWPTTKEGKIPGCFDSPYPPQKLAKVFNNEIAIRGTSLTAVDAIRTLARQHGSFTRLSPYELIYSAHDNCDDFKIVLHSENGLLPVVRFHTQDPSLEEKLLFSDVEIANIRQDHGGFVPLDIIFQQKFKDLFRYQDPSFYAQIKDLSLEAFVKQIMDRRKARRPFELMKEEYEEAFDSIRTKHSIYWKELIGALSFIINFPAKHFSAEDMLRLKETLAPLITVVIAYMPQESCEELLALHKAGRLSVIDVGQESEVEYTDQGILYHFTNSQGHSSSKHYKTFIDCIGQRPMPIEQFPFKSALQDKIVRGAYLDFASVEKAQRLMHEGNPGVVQVGNQFRLRLPGIAVNDHFQAVGSDGAANDRFYVMAVPYMSGYNPDYSGLDFCFEASKRIVSKITERFKIL